MVHDFSLWPKNFFGVSLGTSVKLFCLSSQVGTLISVEEDEGVVKLESGDLKMLMLSHLCRMPYEDGQNPNARRAASSMSGPENDDDDD